MSTTAWWVLGWLVGAAVVLVAAVLLIVAILLVRRIVRQADEITEALDGARRHTEPLFDVAGVNHALERITRGLAALRGEDVGKGEPGWAFRIARRLLPGRPSP